MGFVFYHSFNDDSNNRFKLHLFIIYILNDKSINPTKKVACI